MLRYLLLVSMFLVSFLPGHTQQKDAILYNGSGATAENKLIAMTLAGIVNRESPRLFLLNVYETWSYSLTDEMWRDIYTEDGEVNFTTISDINQLVAFFSDDINGAITYDASLTYGNFEGQNFRWQAEVAAMIGGLTNCIPLPYNNTQVQIERPDSVWVPDPFHGKESLQISAKLELAGHSWNQTNLSQEERYFNLLDWALENLLTRTNPAKFYLREITDWAINQRMFQLNLAGTESLQFASLSEAKAQKIEQVIDYMQKSRPGEIFNVYGWMRPEPLVQWISALGGSFHETLLGNLSWHHSFPAEENFSYQRPSAVSYEEVELQDKHYVLFIASEGDAGNWNLGFQSGAWHSAYRGEVPIGWGFNFHFFEEFPFMGQYYYRTATANDGFIAVTSPLGYTYTDVLPQEYMPDAIMQTAMKVEKYNIPAVYAYKHYNGAGVSDYRGITISNNYNFDKLAQFAEETGIELTFLFDPALSTQKAYWQYGGLLYNHVNDNTFYADVRDLNTTAQGIINKLKSKTSPGFLLAGYQRLRQDGIAIGPNNKADITLALLRNLMDIVLADPEMGDKIEFVTPEQFTWLLQKSILTASVDQNSNKSEPTLSAYTQPGGTLKLDITIPGSEKLLINIYDLTGKLLYQQSTVFSAGTTSHSLPLEGFARGIYLLNISGGSNYLNTKFVY